VVAVSKGRENDYIICTANHAHLHSIGYVVYRRLEVFVLGVAVSYPYSDAIAGLREKRDA
jgi:hypothetical protein